ncbi:LysR family transcriptional regulator [Ralstonia pseudosolanacearum]|uniref:LysR family transcriptional regulator n=1 Tax=Ralstonia pseudosolanacearum TaxID=1310165 RepID=UPI003D0301DC
MDTLDWNDLRYLLAVARSGSAAGAARALGVSHATALRRIQALEQVVGSPLFDRLQTGYALTESGRRFVAMGEAFERALLDTRREIEGQATELAGTIRFTTTDSLGYSLMPDILAAFRARYPGITVEMKVTNARLDLERREADVMLRVTDTPPPSWVGRRLVRLDAALYAAPAYLDGREPRSLESLDWLMPNSPLGQGAVAEWLRSRIGGARVAASADSFLVLRRLAERGLGAVVLPRFLARQRRLVWLEDVPEDLSVPLWLLTHPDLRHAGRVQAFMEHVAQAIRAACATPEAPAPDDARAWAAGGVASAASAGRSPDPGSGFGPAMP